MCSFYPEYDFYVTMNYDSKSEKIFHALNPITIDCI